MVSFEIEESHFIYHAEHEIVQLFLYIFVYSIFSLLPAKMCWDLMINVIKGPQSMMMYKGRGRVAAG